MKSILLKILIVGALFGIIVVVAISFINKKDIEEKTYNILIQKQSTINTSVLVKNAAGVRNSKTIGDINLYSKASSEMVDELNSAIDHYFLYIPVLEELTTKNKNIIVNGYSEYIEALKAAQTNYNSYYSTLTSTQSTNSSVSAASAHFVLSLNSAYEKGTEFFKQLRSIINKDAYENFSSKDWVYISYESVNYQADNLVSLINTEMTKQKEGKAVANLSAEKRYQNFVRLKNYFNTNRASGTELSDVDIAAFVKNYSEIINVVSFWKDAAAYKNALASAASERKAVVAIISFLNDELDFVE